MEAFDPVIVICILASTATSQFITTYAYTRIFRTRNAVAFWGIELVLFTLICPIFKQCVAPSVWVAIGTVLLLVPMLAFLEGPMITKIIVFAVSQILQLLAEIPLAMFWLIDTGLPIVDWDSVKIRPDAYAMTVIIHALILGILFFLFCKICKKVIRSQGGQTAPMQRRDAAFALFPFSQFVLLTGVVYISFLYEGGTMRLLTITLVLFLVCLGVDFLLMRAMRRYAASEILKTRAMIIEQEVSGYLEAASGLQAEIREVAVLRHDLRNHMQVAARLSERAQADQANHYLESVPVAISDGTEKGSVDVSGSHPGR